MNEFEFLSKYIRPILQSGVDSENDDAAHVYFPKSYLIATKDVLVEGVHFMKSAKPTLLAKKALRVSLSDIAAMGAIPHSYLLGISLPKGITEEWCEEFSCGLKEDNDNFDIKLVGGDTTSNTSDIIVISITALGVPGKSILSRSNAKVGDSLYVSGTIGDAALGLLSYQQLISGEYPYLKYRYDLPIPRVGLGRLLCGVASSCIDISDGLLQDVERVCKLSGVGANIYARAIPLSEEAQIITSINKNMFEHAITGGDDYELAFTVPEENIQTLLGIERSTNVKISKIGTITPEKKVRIYTQDGAEIHVSKKGYIHSFD
ncbi:thiamine-phosphate kinase [Candidatus Anaplasma sp. TIGMIC]|uniref:thiamine-phosphate kinase n=1 Tax=Candidatus Anaplasma sp. TIGMIC TaxID=3020713 RepID=UPI00232B31E4|nr:thiamine-phosphate kinase [Candidatus Anaplasma sp. TIGMIC]MDB1135636.1 thiamine-phosphate kinase [Candidatus Anaplasma sp. TIGMIC]